MNGFLLLASLAAAAPRPSTEPELVALLDRLDAELQELNVGRQTAFYEQLRGGPAGTLQEFQARHRRFFQDKETAEALAAWREKAQDPVARRRVELYLDFYLDFLYDTFRLASVEPTLVSSFTALQVELNTELTAFKPLYGGERVGRAAVLDALKFEPKRKKRREAWLASKELSERLAPRIRTLLVLSRDLHRQSGHKGTVEGRLSAGGLDREEVEALFEELEERTRDPFKRLVARARRELDVGVLHVWDLPYWIEKRSAYPEDAFVQDQAEPRLLETVRALGFKPEELKITIETANMANLGWNIPIRMGEEARLVVNPVKGRQFYDTLFHEYGHALHEVLIRQDTGTFRTDRPGAFAESMAEVLAGFVRDPAWQAKTLGWKEETLHKARKAEFDRRLYRLRSLLFRNAFEYVAFDDPEADLMQAYSRLMERFLMVPAPTDPPWADDLFLVQPQVYVQNYVLADLAAAQVREALARRLGRRTYPNPKAAKFLTESFFAHGASKDWQGLLEDATGRRLGAEAYLRELNLEEP